MTVATITASVCHAMKEQPKAAFDQPRSQGGEESGGMDLGLRVLSYLIAGVLVYGLLGWLGDHYFGTKFLLADRDRRRCCLRGVRDHPALWAHR